MDQPVALGVDVGGTKIEVGFVGQADSERGVWVKAMNVPISEPVPLADMLADKYGVPVAVDNDVHAATGAEMMFGVGKRFKDFLYMNVGTGIAIGIVSGGILIRGAANYAGEIGHMTVDPRGDDCVCGRSGCLEPIASGGGMIRRARAALGSFPDSTLHRCADDLHAGNIFEAAREGDPLAVQVKEQAVNALGIAIVNAINLINPEAVVLGGGVMQETTIIDALRRHVAKCSLPAASGSLRSFGVSTLDTNRVGLLGAASLIWR
ncbi:ROK family protein [Paenibacillus tyrfis]|uniref:ROK family protein n=1 Tax=Paenibacillus tyrfis TaxID=1501230 RepID=UPI00055EF46F|nr:ROK family protein [Paenibacillus tyrfis]